MRDHADQVVAGLEGTLEIAVQATVFHCQPSALAKKDGGVSIGGFVIPRRFGTDEGDGPNRPPVNVQGNHNRRAGMQPSKKLELPAVSCRADQEGVIDPLAQGGLPVRMTSARPGPAPARAG